MCTCTNTCDFLKQKVIKFLYMTPNIIFLQKWNKHDLVNHPSKRSNLSCSKDASWWVWHCVKYQESSQQVTFSSSQGIWQDAVVQICIIHLLPHPWGIFQHKTRNCYIQVRKQLLAILSSKNSKEIDHFEEVIQPKTGTQTLLCS